MAVYGTIQVALSVELVCGKIMFRVCCNDHERNRERVHSELYSLGTCKYVSCSVEKLYDTLLRIIRSVCLCVQ